LNISERHSFDLTGIGGVLARLNQQLSLREVYYVISLRKQIGLEELDLLDPLAQVALHLEVLEFGIVQEPLIPLPQCLVRLLNLLIVLCGFAELLLE
jgi:hypothetical protein